MTRWAIAQAVIKPQGIEYRVHDAYLLDAPLARILFYFM